MYFLTSLILGDNLGLNSILEFIESFAVTRCCRICNVGPTLIHDLTKEHSAFLRTVDTYNSDVKHLKTEKSGIKGSCVFNDIIGFHVIKNQSVDVMHDVFEGICNYVMAEILSSLINDKILNINYINNKFKTINFGFESSNLIPEIDLDNIKRNRKIKASSSKSLFFARYFGILFGNQVPRDNIVWELYIKLRNIIHIITSPIQTKSYILQLEMLIEEHHKLYKKLFGPLKSKFHFLIHYVKIIRKNGSVINFSCLRFESKHRKIKTILNNTSCHNQILKTIGTRHLLSLMLQYSNEYEKLFITYGSTIKNSEDIHYTFSSSFEKKEINSVSIDSFEYAKNTFIITQINEDGIEFGKITNIYVVDSNIIFKYISYNMIGFDSHYFGYSVHTKSEINFINYNDLAKKMTCLLFVNDDGEFIVTRYIL